jgi:hypothetical protein
MLLKRKEFKYTLSDKEMRRHGSVREAFGWVKSNDKRILYKDLDKNHIKNILKKHKRNGYKIKASEVHIYSLTNELHYREAVRINILKQNKNN